MPNIKSAKKRVKVTKVKALNNQMVKNALKTCLKKYDSVVASGDKAEAEAMYQITVKKVDQAAAKGILHKNTAARKKSQLTNMLNSIGA